MSVLIYLNAPIIWIFVRVISDLAVWFFKSLTISTVAFASKSSDKLEARDAAAEVYIKDLKELLSNFKIKKQNGILFWSTLGSAVLPIHETAFFLTLAWLVFNWGKSASNNTSWSVVIKLPYLCRTSHKISRHSHLISVLIPYSKGIK